MAWLDDNPPRIQQFRCPRRRNPSGIIGVHTAENLPDETGPDTGAENVANFIRTRTNHGSYHLLCDSDSIIQLVEFRCVAYHIGTHGLNEHTIGISAATQAHRWNTVSARWRTATLRNMGRAAARAARWLKTNYGIEVPARRISLSQALAGQRGFLAHGDADPGRRSDPGASFPWSTFLNYYAAEIGGTGSWLDMASKKDVKDAVRELFTESWANSSGRPSISGLADGALPGSWGRTLDRVIGYAAYSATPAWRDLQASAVWNRENPTLGIVYGTIDRYMFNAIRPDRSQTPGARVGFLVDLDRIEEKVDAALAFSAGGDLTAVLERIDAHHAEVKAQGERAEAAVQVLVDRVDEMAEQAEARDAELLDLVEQVGSGERAAEDVVRLIGEKLTAAPDDDRDS